MTTKLEDRLKDILDKQTRAENVLAEIKAETTRVKTEAAAHEATGVINLLQELARDFSEGLVRTKFDAILAKRKKLNLLNPQWIEQLLGKGNPYGVKLERSQLEFFGRLLNIGMADDSFSKFLAHIVKKGNDPSNPFIKGGE
ncbi:MAG: hypothetical protein SWH78_17640 [Thermodesulfobacteriota bacterium]|nr:hypothetical protein [Thermodesulfobacteriota bacterium]